MARVIDVSFASEPVFGSTLLQKILQSPSLEYRVAKTHRVPYRYRSFSAKEPYIWWLFCGK